MNEPIDFSKMSDRDIALTYQSIYYNLCEYDDGEGEKLLYSIIDYIISAPNTRREGIFLLFNFVMHGSEFYRFLNTLVTRAYGKGHTDGYFECTEAMKRYLLEEK